MLPPDILREIARLAFQGGFSKRRYKQELAAAFRKVGFLPAAKDPEDTRGVQELIDMAGKYLIERDTLMLDVEAFNFQFGSSGPLMDRYPSLKYAIIVNTYQSASRKFTASPINPTIALFHTAHAAANHIFTLLQMTHHPDSVEAHFAISGGVPVFQTMSHLRPGLSPNTNIYGSAIVPTVAIPFTHISPETNATIAWARLGAVNDRFHCCTLPPTYTAYGEEPEAEDFVHAAAKKILLDHTNACYQQPYIQQHLRDLSAFNMLLTSVEPVLPESVANVNPASFDPLFPWTVSQANASLLFEVYGISPTLLSQEGAVGSINYSYFDAEGNEKDDWKFCITPGYPNTLDYYRQSIQDGDIIAVVCTNPASIPAIKAALKGKLFNVLITDLQIAEALLAD